MSTAAKRATILLADDHAVVAEGLRRILDRAEFKVVGVVNDGRALVQAAEILHPDLIVTDFAMPLLNGIDAARKVLAQKHKPKIIFLTMHPEVVYATSALDAGASGYVVKSAAGEELIDAIRAALKGRTYISKSIAESVERARQVRPTRRRGKIDGLTHRQREVLQLLAEGKQAKEVAALLGVSPKTVEFHKYRIMDTVGARTVADLARYAVRHGIVT
jgi:DNA-binding NarL/FixJ family response regulator